MLAQAGRFDPQQLHLSLSNGTTLCIPYLLKTYEIIHKTYDITC